jgi:hypothetical protein
LHQLCKFVRTNGATDAPFMQCEGLAWFVRAASSFVHQRNFFRENPALLIASGHVIVYHGQS